MNIIIILLIFCIVLFLYIHIYFHLKTSNDLEVYEISNTSKVRLEEILDIRQPVIMNYDINNFNNLSEEILLSNYGSFDIKIRNVENDDSTTELYLPIILRNGIKLLGEDVSGRYISENNGDFLQETSLDKTIQSNDEFLRPYMMAFNDYDLIMGSTNTITPFRYNLNYRNYFLCINGKVTLKLAPPKSSKYLHPTKDYDNFEFRSPINPWNVQDQYAIDFDKIKCMEIVLEPGKMIFIPAYWWYSFRFEEGKSSLLNFQYRTYMNSFAIIPELFLSFLQKQNIKHDFVNKLDIDLGELHSP